MPARSRATASSPGPQAGICARTPTGRRFHPGQRPAAAPACRPVRGRRRVQLGWPALSDRRAGRGRGRDQRPLWARGLGALLHAPLWPPRALPHRGDPARRRGRPRHRRPALPRGGPQHRHPSHGWGGVSDHVFGLAHLLGFRFAPRIPNLAERRLYAPGPAATWPALAPFIAGHPDDKRITAHWNDVLRLATSVRTGVISASLMLKRLGAYPRQNGLALALREIGRIERTLYTLDWLEHPSLRRQATAELNKGESRNALARAVCFHRLGRLRDRTAEAQQHRASGLALVTAAIALWNTVYLGRARDALRRRGEAVPNALFAHLAPLGWQHINLTGDYLWGADTNLGPDGFRPLRGTSANPALIDAA